MATKHIEYFKTKSMATREINRRFNAGDPTLWVLAWEYQKGWFLVNFYAVNADEYVADINFFIKAGA